MQFLFGQTTYYRCVFDFGNKCSYLINQFKNDLKLGWGHEISRSIEEKACRIPGSIKNEKLLKAGLSGFPCKNGEAHNSYRGVVCRRRVMQCFSLVKYGFCGNNALYSGSISFKSLFIYYSFWYQGLSLLRIKSEHGIACQSISYVKLLCNLVTWRNNVLSWVYFYVYYFMLFLFHISLGCYWQKCQKGV